MCFGAGLSTLMVRSVSSAFTRLIALGSHSSMMYRLILERVISDGYALEDEVA